MKSPIRFLFAAGFIISVTAGCGGAWSRAGRVPPAGAQQMPAAPPPRKTLRAFGSEQELAKYFSEQAAANRRERERQLSEFRKRTGAATSEATTAMRAEAGNAMAYAMSASKATADDGDGESVTNVQHAGVDEGGIVKVHGDHLVVLRRGRLFTVAIGDGALKPVSAVDAFAPDINPAETWYDEMLVSGDIVAVIGYSYDRGGTEVGLFHIGRDGSLRYRSTYHLRSNDYYSSRNYSSRLIGSKLIFYTPLHLSPEAADPFATFPAMRKWRRGAKEAEFRRILPATRVYRAERAQQQQPPQPARDVRALMPTALHTVTVCDLGGGEMACEATAVIGSPGRVFYVSPDSVYVWTTDWARELEGQRARSSSLLYRLPLDGAGPRALAVAGSPVDQFSFLESADEHLNVLVRSDAAGDGMWAAETAAGDVALLRVPLALFSDGQDGAPPSSYRPLAKPEGDTFQNRFVGDYLLYGTGGGWGTPETAARPRLYAVRWASSDEGAELPLAHGTDRIEALGADALVVGADEKDLHFTSVKLGAERATLAERYTRRGAAQGELRSHGFFYKADDGDSGVLGLPISRAGRAGYEHLSEGSAAIMFLRHESLRLNDIGELASRGKGSVNDACRASCVDWYGNARPLFVRGRVFALLGYEIVEGTFAGERIREARRISYAPRRRETSRR
jgi:hypothetical protein